MSNFVEKRRTKVLDNYRKICHNIVKKNENNERQVKKVFRSNNSVQEWLPIEKIFDNGVVKTKNDKYIKIIKVLPINYNLKSNLEKEAILNSYKIFLKTCNFNIQILIQSNKEDLSQHILNIQKNIQKKKNKYLKEISENNIKIIQNLNY